MMTQPIRFFETLTSDSAAPQKFVQPKLALSFEERHRLEARARYARAQFASEALVDAMLWISNQTKKLVAWFKADMKLRAAEAQLLRMTDRELSDLGLTRSDIAFAVRSYVEGEAPMIEAPSASVAAANQNLRHAA
jgi:uncharacterized protein YjiS (DUF1127 family)